MNSSTITETRSEVDDAVAAATRAVRALTDSRMRDLREGNATSQPDGERGTAIKGTQIPLDAATVDLIGEISQYARDLLSGATGVTVLKTTPAEGALSAWVPMMRGHAADGGYTAEDLGIWTRALKSFAFQIDELIDPSRRIEILVQCPECEATRAPSGRVALTALVRPGETVGAGMRVSCGACGFKWVGEEAIRSLVA